MRMKKLICVAAAAGLAAGLAACGGGDNGDQGKGALVQSYGGALAATGSASGINSTALKESFDSRYLDAGVTQAMVGASLDQDAQAMAAASDYSAFPQLNLTDASVSNCSIDGVCTLSGNLVNADADNTSVPFSVQVISSGGVFRLYGDQKTS